ncbi:MAG: rhodanese-like domain-containing protein [Synergistales bacterium]|nr:rhodanese-like domain-containing protein [Synergistales bacterium]
MRWCRIGVAVFVGIVLAVGCAAAEELQEKSCREVKALLDASGDDVTVFDVRTAEELAETGWIEDAVHIDYNEYQDDPQGLAVKLAQYPKDGSYVVYCKKGGRSGAFGEMMVSLGYNDVTNMEGGMTRWLELGYPVVNEEESSGSGCVLQASAPAFVALLLPLSLVCRKGRTQ